MIDKLYDWQEAALNSKSKVTVFQGGLMTGKTTAAYTAIVRRGDENAALGKIGNCLVVSNKSSYMERKFFKSFLERNNYGHKLVRKPQLFISIPGMTVDFCSTREKESFLGRVHVDASYDFIVLDVGLATFPFQNHVSFEDYSLLLFSLAEDGRVVILSNGGDSRFWAKKKIDDGHAKCYNTGSSYDAPHIPREYIRGVEEEPNIRRMIYGMWYTEMDASDYQKAAVGTAKEWNSPDVNDKVGWAIGIAGETGEIMELVKRKFLRGQDVSDERFKEELGDILWYVAVFADTMGFDLSDIMKLNVDKLKERHG
jgi:NTP pyrophosphatase (non-canonical NTP hydrolase)